jgi:nucleosome assembly protein 1-like 1
MAINL